MTSSDDGPRRRGGPTRRRVLGATGVSATALTVPFVGASPGNSLLVGVDATGTRWTRPLGAADETTLAFGGQRRADRGDTDGWVGTVEVPPA